jgi:opacity protein-like surface antigen
MNVRISAMMCLLCVLGAADLTRAEDPYSQRVADPYAISPDPPTMSSGTLEPYMSFFAGIGIPRSADATFTDGTPQPIVEDVDYKTKFSLGGNLGVWFPTRNKLWGFDLGVELTGFLWYPDVHCCRDLYNNDSTGAFQKDGAANNGTSTEIQGLYIGPNFLIRYPMAISESYPNGRWHPYVGIGVGMHQMAMRPGGSHGVTSFFVDGGNLQTNPIPDQRSTTVGWLAMGGVKAHLFKYVAAFVEAKYVQAHHDGLTSDRFGNSGNFQGFPGVGDESFNLVVNPYSSTISTILVHAGLSIHFDWKP